MSMDLKSLQSVRDFAADYRVAKMQPLKGLVCNAGLKEIRVSVTPDGYEVHSAYASQGLLRLPSAHVRTCR